MSNVVCPVCRNIEGGSCSETIENIRRFEDTFETAFDCDICGQYTIADYLVKDALEGKNQYVDVDPEQRERLSRHIREHRRTKKGNRLEILVRRGGLHLRSLRSPAEHQYDQAPQNTPDDAAEHQKHCPTEPV